LSARGVCTRGSIVIVTGPPGAGKSTTSRSLAALYPRAVYLHTDDFWHYIVTGGIAPYLPEANSQNQTVVKVIAGAASTYAQDGFTVVVDGIMGPWMLCHYRQILAQHPGLTIHYVVLRPNRAVALARAQQRPAAEALIDVEPILSLWDQFADLGPLEDHVIDTTDQTPAGTVRVVANAIRDGRHQLDPQ
jgi:predicted kinase